MLDHIIVYNSSSYDFIQIYHTPSSNAVSAMVEIQTDWFNGVLEEYGVLEAMDVATMIIPREKSLLVILSKANSEQKSLIIQDLCGSIKSKERGY